LPSYGQRSVADDQSSVSQSWLVNAACGRNQMEGRAMSHLLAPGVPPRRSVALQNAQQHRRGARSLFRRQAL